MKTLAQDYDRVNGLALDVSVEDESPWTLVMYRRGDHVARVEMVLSSLNGSTVRWRMSVREIRRLCRAAEAMVGTAETPGVELGNHDRTWVGESGIEAR